MRYKAEYAPQYILDPETFSWDVLTDEVRGRLDVLGAGRYLSLSQERITSAMMKEEVGDATTITLSNREMQAYEVADTTPTPSSASKAKSDPDDSSDDDEALSDPEIPLYKRNIPGIMTVSQVESEVDLDHIRLRLRGMEAETGMLVGWDEGSLDDVPVTGIKSKIAELVAAVGPVLAAEMVVSF